MAKAVKKFSSQEKDVTFAYTNNNRVPKPRLGVDNTNLKQNKIPVGTRPTTDSEYLKQRDKERGILGTKVERKKETKTKGHNLSRKESIRQIKGRGKNKVANNRKSQLLGKINGQGGNLLKKKAAKVVFRFIMYVAFWVWVVQFAFFILMWIMILMASSTFTDATKTIGDGIVQFDLWEILLGLAQGVAAASHVPILMIEKFTGSLSLVLTFYSLTTIIGYIALAIIWIMYKVVPVGIHPAGGEDRGGMKLLLLLISVLLLSIPLTNMIPWWLLWAWYIKMHPA